MEGRDPAKYENYLYDLGYLIREMAFEAKAKADSGGRNDFDVGYLAAFHRVVSLMQQQADSFELPLEKVALAGLDPDESLV